MRRRRRVVISPGSLSTLARGCPPTALECRISLWTRRGPGWEGNESPGVVCMSPAKSAMHGDSGSFPEQSRRVRVVMSPGWPREESAAVAARIRPLALGRPAGPNAERPPQTVSRPRDLRSCRRRCLPDSRVRTTPVLLVQMRQGTWLGTFCPVFAYRERARRRVRVPRPISGYRRRGRTAWPPSLGNFPEKTWRFAF